MRAAVMVAAVPALLLTGCTKGSPDVPEPRQRHLAAAEAALQRAAAVPTRKIAAGESMAAVNRVLGPVRASAYGVCRKLRLPDFRCRLVRAVAIEVSEHDAAVNAYADREDDIRISGGLVRHLGSDAEIAAVLAHEFAHVMFGHVEAKTIDPPLGPMLFGLPGPRPSRGGRQFYRSAIGLRLRAGPADAGFPSSLPYSPEMEIEADRTAVYILRAAGFPLTAMQDALLRLMRAAADRSKGAGSGKVGYLETHPSGTRRLAHLISAVEAARSGTPLKPADAR